MILHAEMLNLIFLLFPALAWESGASIANDDPNDMGCKAMNRRFFRQPSRRGFLPSPDHPCPHTRPLSFVIDGIVCMVGANRILPDKRGCMVL